jgi:GT2 family glycosyltransferase
MRASILIAAHNEGELLWRTVSACHDAAKNLPAEIVVVDDGSTDDSIANAKDRFDDLRIFGFGNRLGPSPTKDRAARESTGDTLIFLDAHCKPEPGSLERLVEDVERLQGKAIVTPTIAPLDTELWENRREELGHGYGVELENFQWQWLPIDRMRPNNDFLESPSLIGCCLAVSRELYHKLWGFDPDMYGWGVEDVDFGVKSWIMGHPVLHDPKPIVGHRFQKAFTTYAVSEHFIIANRLRMAYKICSAALWPGWLDRFRAKHQESLWAPAWQLFTLYRGSADLERAYLHQNQRQDLYAYAARFGLPWPSIN